ncbi:hypothetical protein E2C11_22345 [Streptomyces lavendulae]|nr:hypothetical protein [Streptomyces lavendulae]TXJ76494.1 hypothetical protein E2C11_22345 [Streptomyces lavendulae]
MAESLERKCKAPTAEQITIARALALPLEQATPELVAAAELRVLFRTPLGLTLAGDFGDDEYEVLLDLANRTGLAVPDMEQLECREVLNAWLRVARDRESAAALRRLEPAVDDVVTARDRRKGPDKHGEISSIGANGRLHFRGGHGLGTAPHRVTHITRPGEDGYLDQLHLAREQAAAVQSNPARIARAQEAQTIPRSRGSGPRWSKVPRLMVSRPTCGLWNESARSSPGQRGWCCRGRRCGGC